MINAEILIGLPGYQMTGLRKESGVVRIEVRHEGPVICPHCGGTRHHSKGRSEREVRHEDWGRRPCVLVIEARKWFCLGCGRQFRQRFPGIQPWQRSSEAFQRLIFELHLDGINRSRLGRRRQIAPATVERYFERGLARQCKQGHPGCCPPVLGRSEVALEGYLGALEGRERVRVVCMDLSSTYRALVRKHFPNAQIVADRFHVIRLINHHFLACWWEIDPVGSRNRSLHSLMRRHRHNLKPEQLTRLMNYLATHPALELLYRFKQRLCYLLLKKHRTRKQCRPLAARFLKAVHQLRQAYGFRNFEKYGMRVKVLCA